MIVKDWKLQVRSALGEVTLLDKLDLECVGTTLVQCIGEAFGVDPADDSQRERLSIKPATLPNIFDIYLKTSAKMKPTPGAPSTSSSNPAPGVASSSKSASNSSAATPSAEDKKAADALKGEGNSHMSARRYKEAIESYTKAINLDSMNPVYYSNRAAAYSSAEEHDNAIDDAKKAAEIDPSFVKAYSRLGYVRLFLFIHSLSLFVY